MPRQQHENRIHKSQENMYLIESENPTTADCEYFNVADAQAKDCKIAFMGVINVTKEVMNKVLKGIDENTNSEGMWMKHFKNLKVEIESMKKTQIRKFSK